MVYSLVMKRVRAGYYTTVISDLTVDIEFVTTAYGDSGWLIWAGEQGQINDTPFPTKRDALAYANKWVPLYGQAG